jgi:hypothetical protein
VAVKKDVDLPPGVIFDSPDDKSKEEGVPAVAEASTKNRHSKNNKSEILSGSKDGNFRLFSLIRLRLGAFRKQI